MIRAWIVEGTFSPGQRLNQDELAGSLGLSRLPIREAFKRLESEGLIVIAPHRGAVVAPMSAADIEDIYTVKIALEGTATRLGVPGLTAPDLDQMSDLLSRMDEAAATQDWAAWLHQDRGFHFTLYQASGRPRLIGLVTNFWDLAERYRRLSLAFPHRVEQSADAHRAMYDACRRRDAATAERIIVQALTESEDSLLAYARGLSALRAGAGRYGAEASETVAGQRRAPAGSPTAP